MDRIKEYNFFISCLSNDVLNGTLALAHEAVNLYIGQINNYLHQINTSLHITANNISALQPLIDSLNNSNPNKTILQQALTETEAFVDLVANLTRLANCSYVTNAFDSLQSTLCTKMLQNIDFITLALLLLGIIFLPATYLGIVGYKRFGKLEQLQSYISRNGNSSREMRTLSRRRRNRMAASPSSNYNNTLQSEPPRPKKAPRINTEYKPNGTDDYPPTYDEITRRDLATRENIPSDIMSVEPSVTINPTVELESVEVRPRRHSRVPDNNEDRPRRASKHADDRQKRRSKVPREDSVDEFD